MPAMALPTALTVAGSDPSGGAGLQADLRTFAAFDVHGVSVVTALTVQTARGVRSATGVSPALVAAQLDAVGEVAAVKTGMLLEPAIVEVVAERLRGVARLVVDPVMVATSGAVLLVPAAVDVLRARLLPLATLVTPNLHEAEVLTGRPVVTLADMRDAARALVGLGARAALVTGGHLPGEARDVLHDGTTLHELAAPRVPVERAHGTGCVLSAAITAGLAHGRDLATAVADAKRAVTDALARDVRVDGVTLPAAAIRGRP
jgi:hydroxymethylpyrimidine/phosphomethylpyrimidine kinase